MTFSALPDQMRKLNTHMDVGHSQTLVQWLSVLYQIRCVNSTRQRSH